GARPAEVGGEVRVLAVVEVAGGGELHRVSHRDRGAGGVDGDAEQLRLTERLGADRRGSTATGLEDGERRQAQRQTKVHVGIPGANGAPVYLLRLSLRDTSRKSKRALTG